MGIVDDIKKDDRTKRVLVNTNTKTIGPPSASTGLVGDQAPEETFSSGDFDTIKNQVTLEIDNFQLVDTLNKMGQATNMQSQSGPIMSTLAVKSATIPDKDAANRQIIHRPEPGQVWRVIAMSATWSLDANPTYVIQVGDTTGSDLVTCVETTVNATAQTTLGEPLLNEITSSGSREGGWNPDIHYDYTNPLSTFFAYGGSSITTAPTVRALVVRVR